MKRVGLLLMMSCGLILSTEKYARADDAVAPDRENANAQFVETTYRSICQRMADPASFSYYWNALNEGTKTPAQVREAIQVSCLRGAKADACQRVSGMQDICQNSTN